MCTLTLPDWVSGGTCALPPKADIAEHEKHVRFVLQADHSPLTALQIAPVIGPPTRVLALRGWELNDAATLWEH